MKLRSLPTRHLLATAAALASLFGSARAQAEIELTTPLLSDGALLQRGEPIAISGRGAPQGARVTASLGNSGGGNSALGNETKQAVASGEGTWRVVFDARPAGGPLALTVQVGQEQKTVRDLLLGDVWVCSGQSNMEFVLRDALGADTEIRAANEPEIRHFKIPRSWAAAPEASLAGGSWARATPENAGDFSAVGYYFAKKLHADTGVPIGLIGTNWGGSAIEAWMSAEALEKSPQQAEQAIREIIENAERDTVAVKKTFGRWPGSVIPRMQPAKADFSAPRLDTGDWASIEAPGLWEGQGFSGVDGVIWYRKTIELSAAEARGELVLGLARIDDNDTAWVNGHEVGSTHAYGQVRSYTIPAGVAHAGENSIAVRVEDTGVGGGIYSDRELLFLQTADGKRRSLAGTWKIRPDKVTVAVTGDMNHVDTALYNKMIHPLLGTPVKGILWYQGESNADSAEQAIRYAHQFKSLIRSWRAGWKEPELPFYWVQLASYESGRDTNWSRPWAMLRESQAAALSLPHTGQAITLDVGEARDIHPRDKQTVGTRLALIALAQDYGKPGVHHRGPALDSAAVDGSRLIVRFDTHEGLATDQKSSRVLGFEIGRPGSRFAAVAGTLEGNTVVIPFQGPAPTAVRYAWDDNPEAANLQDRKGLPAEPFRALVGNP